MTKRHSKDWVRTKEPAEIVDEAPVMAPIVEDELEGDKFEHLPKKDALRLNEVSDYLGVDTQTIRNWMQHGYFEVEKMHGTLFITTRSIKNFRLRSGVRFPRVY